MMVPDDPTGLWASAKMQQQLSATNAEYERTEREFLHLHHTLEISTTDQNPTCRNCLLTSFLRSLIHSGELEFQRIDGFLHLRDMRFLRLDVP